MDYEIVMPQLSDSMSEGKLISWRVKEGDSVKSGDVIAEVESDKAIMEVQTFKDGIIKELRVKAGDSAPVGSVIAVIETNNTKSIKQEKEPIEPIEPKKEQKKPTFKKESKSISTTKATKDILAVASPRAKDLAKKYGIDIQTLQKEAKLPKPTHVEDLKQFLYKRYFTPKARELIKKYQLDISQFKLNRKYRYNQLLSYIKEHNIPMLKPISSIQKAIIDRVEKSNQKPIYHIYDDIDASLLIEYSSGKKSITVWLLKIFAQAMMDIKEFRSRLNKDTIEIFPNASISLAMANEEALYMPVFKDINLKSSDDIAKELSDMKQKVKDGKLEPKDLRGSTFGLSNLGMVGIKRFDAMINQDDSAIAAIGANIDGKIAVTLTIDHRLINGWQGALFMQRVKELAVDKKIFE